MKKKLIALLVIALPFSCLKAAGCSTEVRRLADDLQGIPLTQRQTQQLASILFDARKLCFAQQDTKAIGLINKARELLGLKPSTGEFDWENVPLESLEIND